MNAPTTINPDEAIGAPYRVTTQSVNLNVFRSLMNNGTYLTQSVERMAVFASNLAVYNCNVAMSAGSNMSNLMKTAVWASNSVMSNQQHILNLQNRASNWDFASNVAVASAATSYALLARSSNWDFASNAVHGLSNVAYAASNAALYSSTLAFAIAQREPDWNYASNMIKTLQTYITSVNTLAEFTSNALSNYVRI
jgi:hypothetical protein